MGRLMDSLAAAVGLKPSDRVPVIQHDDDNAHVQRTDQQVDCISCRITGATVLGGTGMYVLVIIWRNPGQLEATRLRNLRVGGVVLATGMLALSGCRLFNKGPFRHLDHTSS